MTTNQAFRARLDRHFRDSYPRLVREWATRAGGAAQAEDLIQDAYTAMYRAYGEGERLGDTKEVLDAAIRRSIRNLWIDRYRAAIRAPIDNTVSEASEREGGHEPFIDTVADTNVPAEDELAVRDLCTKVMAQLTPHWRSAIGLLLADRTVPDIAAFFGRDGYTIRREARAHFCRALSQFAATDSAAKFIGSRVCGWAAA